MNQDRWQKIKGLFEDALKVAPKERKRFLDNSCGQDDELRREVESLLASDENAQSFLENPASNEVASLIMKSPEHLAVGKSFGHYEIIKQIGAGGMGEVYLATDKQLKRKVALKILTAEMVGSPEHSRRFEQEAFAASALNHPNILTIYEIGEVADVHFIAAEFVDGETLREKLHDKSLTISEALEIAIQTASAKTRLKIPNIYGIDSIHGANYVKGATLFPQEIGMAATWNPLLMQRAEEITAMETRAAAIPWSFSPVLDIGRQPLWARFWETFGEDPYLAKVMGAHLRFCVSGGQ